MIDIHAHILPDVDDGSTGLDESIKMLRDAEQQGITDIILTPHYRRDYDKTEQELLTVFNGFCAEKEKQGINVNLYLGQEIYIEKEFKKKFKEGLYLPLCGTKYVLIEFEFNEDHDIAETVYDLLKMGYKPIVAHIERYSYADRYVAREVKALGGYIQVNADSICGKYKRYLIRKVKALFEEDLVDFVASDIHQMRNIHMEKAYSFVSKKYGKQTAERVFKLNAEKIIKG